MAKLFKRGRIWYAWIRRKRGGVRRVSTLCTDKRAAEAVLSQLEREAVDPAYAAANKTTTQHVLDEYLRSRSRLGRAEGTLRFTKTKAGALLGLLPKLAADIVHAVTQRYVDVRLSEGARATTIKKELRVLKAALRLAKRNGEWLGDADAVIPELDDDAKAGERFLTPWEMVGLATVLTPRRMALVAFAVATGCDPGALWRARREDVSEDFGRVRIRGTKRASRDRIVPLEHPLQRMLVSWALERAQPGALLFERWSNVRRDLHIACDKLGIPGCSPNDLRRTFGTWLRSSGVEPQLIGAAMGHADSRMVERVYGKLTPDALSALLKSRMGGGILMGSIADVSTASGARGALPEPSARAAEQGRSLDSSGAQGRSRTADTRIFSPVSGSDAQPENLAASVDSDEPIPDAWAANGRSVAGAEPLFAPRAAAFCAGLLEASRRARVGCAGAAA